MTSSEEKHWNGLGLPDDLDEVALQGAPQPDAAAVARIKRMALAKAGAGVPARPVRTRRPWWLVAAAVAVLAVGGVLVAGPANVAAAIQKAMSFVPGFGERPAGEVSLAAVSQVEQQQGDELVRVQGLVADANGVSVKLYARNVGLGPLTSLEVDGKSVPLTMSTMATGGGSSGTVSWGWLTAQVPVSAQTRSFTVVVRDRDLEFRLAVPVVPGSELGGVDDLFAKATAGNFTVMADVAPGENRTMLNVLVRGLEAGQSVTELGQYWGKVPATRPVHLTTDTGVNLPVTSNGGAMAGGLWELEAPSLPKDATQVRLTIPAMGIQEQGQGEIKLKVATADVNQVVRIGRYEINIQRTEWDGKGLKVFVQSVSPGLSRFGQLELNGKLTDWGSEHDVTTGQMLWFQVDPAAGAKSATLTFKNPIIVVDGPWVIDLPVTRP